MSRDGGARHPAPDPEWSARTDRRVWQALPGSSQLQGDVAEAASRTRKPPGLARSFAPQKPMSQAIRASPPMTFSHDLRVLWLTLWDLRSSDISQLEVGNAGHTLASRLFPSFVGLA